MSDSGLGKGQGLWGPDRRVVSGCAPGGRSSGNCGNGGSGALGKGQGLWGPDRCVASGHAPGGSSDGDNGGGSASAHYTCTLGEGQTKAIGLQRSCFHWKLQVIISIL
ncbi:hypothetical protein Vretimale_1665 [Volvox reticuliferus]|uniref:Uncharacterized protein n=1 Tax=Volvox reticuliferus TaxID=1737510 RepID=A0A8J4CXI8_9CHLO|nr:hypothetical protein Vretifemale_15537 [Volvox reticuliferus]GIL95691.1 hypothetical protein Vretimale_1665 [Volvox reticuliferus]